MLEAIILAGGFGTRLKEAVPDLPKPMAPIKGKPFLAYLLENLSQKGFKRAILSLGYMPEKIIDYFGTSFNGIEIIYSVEKETLGTGGATKLALERCTQDHVYVINGDTYLDFEIEEIELLWHKNHQPMIVGVNVENTSRYGSLEIVDGRVISFKEKAFIKSGPINAGCYIFRRAQLENCVGNELFSLESDFLANEVRNESFYYFSSRGKFLDIGIPEDYEAAKYFIEPLK
jgi:D-glycero-alpha-D-manno-heptose 1-phosphate guanylyltransferase